MYRPVSASLTGRRCAVRRLAIVLLGCALLLGTAVVAPGAEAEQTPPLVRSGRDLGNVACAGAAIYCAQIWRAGLALGLPFNVLISEACMHVGLRESEDAGIACAERAIGAVHTLPPSVLLAGQFAPGEREHNALWSNASDQRWSIVVADYFARIPGYCDNTTPVIFDYFPCLLREVHYFQSVIKRFRRS